MWFNYQKNTVRVVIDMVREKLQLVSLEWREVVLTLATVIQNILWNSAVLGRGDTSLCFI